MFPAGNELLMGAALMDTNSWSWLTPEAGDPKSKSNHFCEAVVVVSCNSRMFVLYR